MAAVVAFLFAVTWNYGLNRVWTFREFESNRYSYVSFVLISAVGLGIRVGIMHLLLEYAGMKAGRLYIIASFVGILFASVFNFIAARYISFPDQSKKTGNMEVASKS
jgi:putative flippase GtrA